MGTAMIPGERLSSLLVAGPWLVPDNLETSPLEVYERGSIGLNDPSAGLRYQDWRLRLVGSDVLISADNWPDTLLFSRAGITELDLAFDQNMNPFVAFVEAGQAKFWWFDTDVSQTVFSNLPANSLTPRCCLDDKRETQTSFSDIILCYALNGNLYYRQQRNRFTIQKLLQSPFVNPQTGGPGTLIKVGMNEHNRLQWLCNDRTYDGPC